MPDIYGLRLQFTDILGNAKSIDVPQEHAASVIETGMPFDGSSIEGFVRISESDMYLKPDLPTKVGGLGPKENWYHPGFSSRPDTVTCDVYTTDGEPFIGDPRSCLKRQLATQSSTFVVGPEPEFFLLKDGSLPADAGGYFDQVSDPTEKLRRIMVQALDYMQFDVEAAHHEVAPGQHEIDFRFAEAVETADRLIRFKILVKEMAHDHGYEATFMPKPFAGENGSGMHCHMSLWDGDHNLFYDPAGPFNLSSIAQSFIAGVLKHVKALSALTNPTVNSYKRLVPGYEAPVNICWGQKNRSALIRIPATASPERGTRIEMRNPDPSCNPYLAFAAIHAAGMDGVNNNLTPPAAVSFNLYEASAQDREGIEVLPGSLDEALDHLEENEVIAGALGPHIMESFLRAKRNEAEAFRLEVTEWERRRYFGL